MLRWGSNLRRFIDHLQKQFDSGVRVTDHFEWNAKATHLYMRIQNP